LGDSHQLISKHGVEQARAWSGSANKNEVSKLACGRVVMAPDPGSAETSHAGGAHALENSFNVLLECWSFDTGIVGLSWLHIRKVHTQVRQVLAAIPGITNDKAGCTEKLQ
jgi:hypothetical protein